MDDADLLPLDGVSVDGQRAPVDDCPVHGVIRRLRDVVGAVPAGILGNESDEGLAAYAGDFGETLPLLGSGWARVDVLDVLDSASEADHAFAVVDETDSFRSRQKLRYPDGTTIEDQGVAHEDGVAQWQLLGLDPGHDALVIIRTDVVYAGGDVEARVGEHRITFPDFAPDRRNRWRNRAIPIPGGWIDDATLSFGLTRVDSNKDLSHFKVWVYQSIEPAAGAPDASDDPDPVAATPVAEPVLESELSAVEDLPQETVDIPASSLLDPPSGPEPLHADDASDGSDAGNEPESAPIDEPEAEESVPDASSDAVDSDPAPEPIEPAPVAEPDASSPAADAPAPVLPVPTATAASASATHRLVTITLAPTDAPHGAITEHLGDALKSGWRVQELQSLPGSSGGWLVVLLTR